MPEKNSKHWSEQAEAMVEAWSETQKVMWENWSKLAWSASAPPPFYSDLTRQWQDLARQGLEAWTAGAEPTAKNVAERLFASQEAMNRFLKFSMNAWQSILVKFTSGEAWQSTLNTYLDELHRQLSRAPEGLLKTSQDTGELWRLYLEQLNQLAQPWVKSLQQTPEHWDRAAVGDGSALIKLAHLYQDAYEWTFGRLLDMPSLGYTRELNEKLLKGFEAWQAYRQADFEYQVMLADAWGQAFEQFMRRLVALAEQGEVINSLQALLIQWTQVADPVFIGVFRSEEYIRVQGRLLNATMAYRSHQREITEILLTMSDIPTRTEVDEAHKRIYEQRKEIKALKKALAKISSTPQTKDAPTQEQWDQTQQTINELRQEIESLKKSLVELSGAATEAKQGTTTRKQTAKRKKVVSEESSQAGSNKKGSEHVTTDPA